MNTPDARSWRAEAILARPAALVGLVAGLAALSPAPALAQGPVEQVNAFYNDIREDQRSDLVLLPVLADLEAPPIGAQDIKSAVLMPPGSTNWDRAVEWATAEPQVAVLEALDRITQDENARTAMAFGQPYGPGVPRTLIARGMYTELGDPPSLAAASFQYMDKLADMGCLVHIEATRRAASGDPAAALDVLTDWLFFALQMADREFYRESVWGYQHMLAALERIRDVVYNDMRGAKALTVDHLTAEIARIKESGIVGIERLSLPRADRIAAQQLIERVFDRQGQLNPAAFSSAMASVGSSDRPLRLFSEAARWSGAADGHATRAETEQLLGSITADFEARWRLDPFDQRNNTAPVFARVDGVPEYAVLDAAMDDLTTLLDMRQQLRAEAVGTRTALGVVGYFYQTRNLPPTLSAIRPRWTEQLEADPYNPQRSGTLRPSLEYFVPVRDTRAQGGGPHEMNVVAYDSNFSLSLGQDQFVLYSVGPNRTKDWARFVSREPRAVAGDYLLWPPVMSLLRIDLQQQGLLD